MLFNPDLNKRAVVILSSKQHEKENYPRLTFNDDNIQTAISQKHLGLVLDSKLDFNEHNISNKINKCNKIIGIMKKLSLFLSWKTLLTIYKSLVRPNLDCADVIQDKPFNEYFKTKSKMNQCRAALVITWTIKGSSRDRFYQEIGLESLADRRWSRKIFFFHKIVNGLLPSYLQSYLNHYNYGEYQTRSACQNKIKTLSRRTKAFNSSFYPYSIKQWCAFSEEIRNIVSVNKFKETIISFIRRKENSVFAIHGTKGLKLLTCLRLNFNHLNEHKFRHGFKDTIDPMCKCGVETETTLHFLLRCRLYSDIGTELLDDIYTVDSSLTNYPDEKLLNILLYGSEYFSVKTNQSIHYSHIFEKFSTL